MVSAADGGMVEARCVFISSSRRNSAVRERLAFGPERAGYKNIGPAEICLKQAKAGLRVNFRSCTDEKGGSAAGA